MEPASIRYKNPGAMWGRTGKRPSSSRVVPTNAALPLKWGSKQTVYLSDGTGQGNNIAVFDTWVQGICAQLDLWRTSKNYRNKRFCDAIAIWSGHNNVESYIAYVLKRVPGMTRNTVMNDVFWSSPMGIGFLKAQAGHEAGKVYPAPAGDWLEAQKIVFGGKVAAPPAPVPASTKAAAGAATASAPVVAGAATAFPWWQVGLGALAVAVVIGIGIYFWRRREAAKEAELQRPALIGIGFEQEV